MGERLVNNAELIFENCVLPEDSVVGEPGRGFEVLTTFFPASNAYTAADRVGNRPGCIRGNTPMDEDPCPGGLTLD